MLQFTDNVDGCVFNIKELHSTISFPSPSDALLASLLMRYDSSVPLEFVDELLSLFRHENFRSDHLTARKAEDLMERVSEQRCLIAEKRLTKQSVSGQIPELIVELVAEDLDAQRTAFHRVVDLPPEHWHLIDDAEMALHSMSLAHRSWTRTAQNCLRRRILISSTRYLRPLLQSPLPGPWVRELSFGQYDKYANTSLERVRQHMRTLEFPQLLCAVLKRCPNLESLYMQEFLSIQCMGEPVRQIDHDLIDQIGTLTYLEHLSLHQPAWDVSPGQLWMLRNVLPRLQHLESLSLKKWTSEDEPDTFVSSMLPSPRLVSFSFSDIRTTNTGVLSWLMQICAGYPQSKLELCLADMRIINHTMHENADPRVFLPEHILTTKLRLLRYEYDHDIGPFLRRFPRLRSLSLCLVSRAILPEDSFVLPESLVSLHLHISLVDVREDYGRGIVPILSSSPNIRDISITYGLGWGEPGTTKPMLNAALDHCTKYKIQITVEKGNLIPFFEF